MKTYRVSDATIEQLARKQTIVLRWVVVLVPLIIAGVFTFASINSEREIGGWDIAQIAIVLVVGAVMTFFAYRNGARQLRKRYDNTYGKYEVDLTDDSITMRDYLVPSGITIHRSEIRALQESASGNELVIHRIGTTNCVMILDKVDGFEEIKEAISAWAPHEAKPIRIIGQRYLPLVMGIAIAVTICPLVPLSIGLVLGIPVMLVYGYLVFKLVRYPGIKLGPKLFSLGALLLVTLVNVGRVALVVISLTQPAS